MRRSINLIVMCMAIMIMHVRTGMAVVDRVTLPIDINDDTYLSVGTNYHSDEGLDMTKCDFIFNTREAGVYTFRFHPIPKISDFIISVKDRYYEEVFGERRSVTEDAVYHYYLDGNETYRLQLYALNGFIGDVHFDFAIYPPSSSLNNTEHAPSSVVEPDPSPEEEYYYGDLYVVNCEEWVSLRRYPDTSSERLAKVPLGAKVYNCYASNYGFYFCDYNGITGYILKKYLSSNPPIIGSNNKNLSALDDKYDLNQYEYYPVVEKGRGSLVFQKSPGGSFMKNHKFHDGDYIYVHKNWRQNGYAIAYENGEYGYVDASYIDW